MNTLFEHELSKYEYKKEVREKFRNAFNEGLKRRLTESLSIHFIEKKNNRIKTQVDVLEEKFVLNKIDQSLYEKYRKKHKKNVDELSLELNKFNFDSSNRSCQNIVRFTSDGGYIEKMAT